MTFEKEERERLNLYFKNLEELKKKKKIKVKNKYGKSKQNNKC